MGVRLAAILAVLIVILAVLIVILAILTRVPILRTILIILLSILNSIITIVATGMIFSIVELSIIQRFLIFDVIKFTPLSKTHFTFEIIFAQFWMVKLLANIRVLTSPPSYPLVA